MSQHYTRNTKQVMHYCPTCNRQAMHRVDDRRLGCCLEDHSRFKSAVTADERRELFWLMSPEQAELRAEREAIMLTEGASAEEVERCCNSQPVLFGFVGKMEQQEDLF